jgi:hypothetical protein
MTLAEYLDSLVDTNPKFYAARLELQACSCNQYMLSWSSMPSFLMGTTFGSNYLSKLVAQHEVVQGPAGVRQLNVLMCQEDLPELIPEIPSHYELPWRSAFGRPYNMGTVSYMGAARQATPLHYDDVENLVR